MSSRKEDDLRKGGRKRVIAVSMCANSLACDGIHVSISALPCL